MVNLSTRTHFPERPLQTCNRVHLTDPDHRILDASVSSDRFGLRTYAEYPATNFPAVSHLATFDKNPKPWNKGNAYKVNDIIALPFPGAPKPIQAVCIRDHTAADDSAPVKGPQWQQNWILKLPANAQFFGDPLTAGAYDPATGRAGNWITMNQFTLDIAFVLNADPKIYPEQRMLCGTVMGNASQPHGRVWMLVLRPNGELVFNLTLADQTSHSIVLAKGCSATGVYRLAVQLDYPSHTLQGWLAKPGEADLARTCSDSKSIPENSHFIEMEYGFLTITGADNGGPGSANGTFAPPTDITLAGLHMSAGLRYADDDSLRRRDNQKPADDQFRYFTNDATTTAFLPLTDNPPEAELKTSGVLVTVQHGPASGDANQKGFGYFKASTSIYGIGQQRISDMKIIPGPVWGAGIVTWHALAPQLSNLDIRGGFYAIGDLFYGAQYTFDIRDCLLSGSEAAINGSSNIIYLKHTTIDPVGRFGILLSGSNIMADDVRFGDPQLHHSQYYFRHISTVDYGGMNLLTNIRAEAAATSRYPDRAAFSQKTIGSSRTSFVLRDCSVANLADAAAFLELPFVPSPCSARLLMENCRYQGNPIAAWIRTDSPWWSGPVTAFDPAAPVKKRIDFQPPPARPWKPATAYKKNALAESNEQVWRCLADHTADTTNAPGRGDFWAPAVPHIAFIEEPSPPPP